MNAIDALLQGKKGVVATKKTGKVSAIDQLLQKKPVKPTIQPVKTTLPTQQNYIKATLPKDLGGGSYYLQRGEPNKLITPEATKTYGSLKPKTGQERDHFIAQSLGGASDDYNLNYVPAEVNQAWAKIERKNLNAYKRGEISLPQARLNVLKEKQEWLMKQNGISQSVKDNLIYTAKDPVNPVNTARAVLKMVKSPVSLVKEYAKAIMPKTTAELETQIEAQKKSNQPMRFDVGAGMSNVEKVLPGPRLSTLEAIQQGAQIEPVQAGEAPQVSPVRQAQQVVRKPDLSPEKPSAIDKLLSGIKLSYDTNPFMPSRSNPLQSNFEVALESAEKKIFEKTLNTDLGKKVITKISESTEDIPLKLLSGIEAAGTSKTYGEVYSGWKKAKENPDNPLWKKFIYNFQSSAPQSLLGVAMSFVPYAGKPLAYAYWSALSAGEQIQDKGEVTSAQNIAIDTIGDSLLGGSLEGLFKKPAKTLISTLKKSFLTEGGTESAQTLLKYANDYRTAKNETDRNQAISNAKQYITSGAILMEFSIGGLSGASIGGLGFAANKTIGQQPGLSMPDKPTEPTGLQFSGQELLQPKVKAIPSPKVVAQTPQIKPQKAQGDVLPTKTTKVSPEAKPSVVEPLIEEAKKYKSAEEFVDSIGEETYKKIYKPILSKVDDISVNFESTCVDCKGGADFVDNQMAKAIEVPKKGKWANKIREQWAGQGGFRNGKIGNRIDDYDTSLYLTDDYLIFQESGIENFYKLENAPKINSKSQLTDIWNKANKTEPKKTALPKPIQKTQSIQPKKPSLPKPKKSDIIKAKETPKTKIIPKTSELKAKKEKEEFTSKVFERIQAENPELLKGDLKATKIYLDNESKKAIKLMEKDKQAAYNLAMGREESSDVLGTSVNIAMTEKALEEGNNKLAAKLIKNRSLAQTRRGQELVAEKGSITDNSTSRYVKELLSNRLDKLGDKYTDGIKDVLKKGSKKENAINKIEKEIANVEIAITNKKLDTKTALALLEKMTCI